MLKTVCDICKTNEADTAYDVTKRRLTFNIFTSKATKHIDICDECARKLLGVNAAPKAPKAR